MAIRFHVTSSANRASIRQHGLDWSRMGAAPGIAGSIAPEVQGCFLAADERDVDYFAAMNNTGGPVDVWEVVGVDDDDLLEFSGYAYLPARIPRGQLRLARTDLPPARTSEDRGRAGRPARTQSSNYPAWRPTGDGG